MAEKTDRIYIRMPQERADKIKASAKEAGLSYSQYAGMLTWMGYKVYQRQVNPENMLTMEQLAELGKIYEEKYGKTESSED